ncbi:putative linoleate 9S-lipoxygenase 5 [Drosera capensis]
MLRKLVGNGSSMEHDKHKKMKSSTNKITGTVILMKKNILELNDPVAGVRDRFDELKGETVSFRFVSADPVDSAPKPSSSTAEFSWVSCFEVITFLIQRIKGRDSKNDCMTNHLKGKLSEPANLEHWLTELPGVIAADSIFKITFDWDNDMGVPGAFLVRNEHHNEFYLKTVTLDNVPHHDGKIHFICNSWVYPTKDKKDRIFFSNKAYLPHETPEPLKGLREEELETLRGTGEGERKEWDRVYDYALYNDLGDPDKGLKYVRPTLGGSSEYPYPRRGRTGRPPSEKDPKCESRVPLPESLSIYVPRDERFSHVKLAEFAAYGVKSGGQVIVPELESLCGQTPKEFDCFQDVLKLYEGGIASPKTEILDKLREKSPLEMLKVLLPADGRPLLKFPTPQVIKEDEWAWRTDEEFAREMLAGVNPVVICRLEAFPPVSKLDPKVYGNQNSSITEKHIEGNLEGLTVYKALEHSRLFLLDHHDTVMPYLRRINTASKSYASRTLLFLKSDGTLKPVAIELSLPHPNGDEFGAVSEVYTPAEKGVENSIWQLAKAYVAVNDSGNHQVISHWLRTHATMEPFIIATNRQLSILHPIHKLLLPHFRDTMNINALGRQILINAGGMLERTVFQGKYAMEISSLAYKDWVLTDQALPRDLLKRGMAVEDSENPRGYKLLVEDYPFAVDGLEIWSAIETWVKEYCSFYYKDDAEIVNDTELQNWWQEVREKGHGDKKDEPWWPKMKTLDELIESCTIIIWVASALHAAINFGQYPYGGYGPNRPSLSRRFMPEPGTPEYEELKENPDAAFLKTITSPFLTMLGITLIEILSIHSSDEVYLGQRDTPEWTSDAGPLKSFERFGEKLRQIEQNIVARNCDERYSNRVGPVKMPYYLLYPTSESGLTGQGIPNSVSM